MLREFLLAVFTATTFFACNASPGFHATQVHFTLQGTVIDQASGLPLVGARVDVVEGICSNFLGPCTEGRLHFQTETDIAGTFSFSGTRSIDDCERLSFIVLASGHVGLTTSLGSIRCVDTLQSFSFALLRSS
jgi:hypothetical protein